MVDRYAFMVARCVPDSEDYENQSAYVKYDDYAALEQRLKEQADAYSELIAQLHRDVAARDGRFDAYRAEVRALVEAAAELVGVDQSHIESTQFCVIYERAAKVRAALAAGEAEDD
jgi:response regulator RpfG family c-di-GMP phosphodiesterase